MKRVIFILSICLCTAITLGFDNIMDRMSDELQMSKMEIYNCFSKANATLIDLMIMSSYLNETTPDVDNPALKASCFFVCLLQKKELMVNTTMDTENIKKALDKMLPEKPENIIRIRNQILDTCFDQVQNSTDNECEIILNMIKCVLLEDARYENSKVEEDKKEEDKIKEDII